MKALVDLHHSLFWIISKRSLPPSDLKNTYLSNGIMKVSKLQFRLSLATVGHLHSGSLSDCGRPRTEICRLDHRR